MVSLLCEVCVHEMKDYKVSEPTERLLFISVVVVGVLVLIEETIQWNVLMGDQITFL